MQKWKLTPVPLQFEFGKFIDSEVQLTQHSSFHILLGLAWKGQKAACGFNSQHEAADVKPGCSAHDRAHVYCDRLMWDRKIIGDTYLETASYFRSEIVQQCFAKTNEHDINIILKKTCCQ